MNEDREPIGVFCCYAHEDETLRVELKKHLSLLFWSQEIQAWSDRELLPGTEWNDEIDARLKSASVVLFLVSSDFLDSEYIRNVEMTAALEMHHRGEAVVVPVILRPAKWDSAPFAKLQVLPRDGKAVTSWKNRDEAFENIAQGLEKVIKEIRAQETQAADPATQAMVAASVEEIPSGRSRPHAVATRAEEPQRRGSLAQQFFRFHVGFFVLELAILFSLSIAQVHILDVTQDAFTLARSIAIVAVGVVLHLGLFGGVVVRRSLPRLAVITSAFMAVLGSALLVGALFDNAYFAEEEDGGQVRVPQAVITNLPGVASVPLQVRLDGTSSVDPEGSGLSFEWSVNGEKVGERGTLDFEVKDPGDYSVGLRVTDGLGREAELSKTLHVGKFRLLWVTDNRSKARGAQEAVESAERVLVVPAASTRDALKELREQRVDAVLTDVKREGEEEYLENPPPDFEVHGGLDEYSAWRGLIWEMSKQGLDDSPTGGKMLRILWSDELTPGQVVDAEKLGLVFVSYEKQSESDDPAERLLQVLGLSDS